MAQLALNGTIQTPLSVNYVTSTSDNGSNTTYTFSGVSIKQPGLIVIGVHSRRNDTAFTNLSSVTVNGVSATIVENVRASFNTGTRSSLAYIRVATGTTADIVLTYSVAQNYVAVSIYNIQGNLSDTPLGSANSSSVTPGVTALNLNLLTSENIQVGIGICSSTASTDGGWSSTQLGALATSYALANSSGDFHASGTSYKRGSATGTTMLQAAAGGAFVPAVLVAAVWR